MNFKVYKKGQGKYTRLTTAAALMLIAAFGCWKIYQMLEAVTIANTSTKLWVQNLVPIVVLAFLGFIVYWLLNKPLIADFMINAEGEVKKVNWSSRKEIIVSTYIVIFTVIFFAVFLGFCDVAFVTIFDSIGL